MEGGKGTILSFCILSIKVLECIYEPSLGLPPVTPSGVYNLYFNKQDGRRSSGQLTW